jgi:hypothetical protein
MFLDPFHEPEMKRHCRSEYDRHGKVRPQNQDRLDALLRPENDPDAFVITNTSNTPKTVRIRASGSELGHGSYLGRTARNSMRHTARRIHRTELFRTKRQRDRVTPFYRK